MKSICGTDCEKCIMKNSCAGCVDSKGCPFGKRCFIAEYLEVGGENNYLLFKKQLIDEINALNIEGMPKVDELFALCGSFVNLEYTLPSGDSVKFLDDNQIYLGTQLKNEFCADENKKCFGLVANASFILICEYFEGGVGAEIVLFKRR